MVFLRRDPAEDGERRIEGAQVYLRHPDFKDFQEWAELRSKSRAFLTPWEPTWAEDELSKAAFRYRVRRYLQDIDDGRAYPFFMFRRADHRLVGGATLSQVRRGAAQATTLGYWIGAPHQNRGYTTDAVRTLVASVADDPVAIRPPRYAGAPLKTPAPRRPATARPRPCCCCSAGVAAAGLSVSCLSVRCRRSWRPFC